MILIRRYSNANSKKKNENYIVAKWQSSKLAGSVRYTSNCQETGRHERKLDVLFLSHASYRSSVQAVYAGSYANLYVIN